MWQRVGERGVVAGNRLGDKVGFAGIYGSVLKLGLSQMDGFVTSRIRHLLDAGETR